MPLSDTDARSAEPASSAWVAASGCSIIGTALGRLPAFLKLIPVGKGGSFKNYENAGASGVANGGTYATSETQQFCDKGLRSYRGPGTAYLSTGMSHRAQSAQSVQTLRCPIRCSSEIRLRRRSGDRCVRLHRPLTQAGRPTRTRTAYYPACVPTDGCRDRASVSFRVRIFHASFFTGVRSFGRGLRFDDTPIACVAYCKKGIFHVR